MKTNKPLTEKEKRELEIIDDPNIKFWPPRLAFIVSLATFGLLWKHYLAPFKIRYAEPKKRKDRVVKLRTKMRLYKLEINPDKDYQVYYKIVREEENRFDERFKKRK